MAAQIEIAPGQAVLGRYEVIRVLGRGAMGEVFEVLDRPSGRHYAMKRVSPQLASRPGQMEAIRSNFALVSGLTHPHIAVTRFLETDPTTGELFILMDLVRGCDLGDWIREQRDLQGDHEAPLPTRLVLGIAEQIASALDYAHAQPASFAPDGSVKRYGILHRDLKPENVMVETGRFYRTGIPAVKVVDFGLAAEIQASLQSMTQGIEGLNRVIGTPLYMAPEQWLGRRLTRAIDQWALAVILYEMLAGRPPFGGVPLEQLRLQICDPQPDRPDNLTTAQWNALRVGMNSDRNQRYQSCIALVKALAQADASTHNSVQAAETLLPDDAETVRSGGSGSHPALNPETVRDAARQVAAQGSDSKVSDGKGSGNRPVVGAARTLDPNSAAGRETDDHQGDLQTRGNSWKQPSTPPQLAPAQQSAAPASRGWGIGAWLTVCFLLLSALLLTAAVAGILLQLRTRAGLLIVEVDQPGAVVSVNDREEVTITQPGVEIPLQIEPQVNGQTLKVTKAGFEVYSRKLEIRSGDRETIRIELKPLPQVAAKVPVKPLLNQPPDEAANPKPKTDPSRLLVNSKLPVEPVQPPVLPPVTEPPVTPPPAAEPTAKLPPLVTRPKVELIDPKILFGDKPPFDPKRPLTAPPKVEMAPVAPPTEVPPPPVEPPAPIEPPAPVKQPVQFEPITVQSAFAGQEFKLSLQAVDPNTPSGAVRYELAEGAPPNLTLSLTGKMRWQVPADQWGPTKIDVRAISSLSTTPVGTQRVLVWVKAKPEPTQAELLLFNQELVQINARLAQAGTDFGQAVGNSIRTGNYTGLQAKYTTLGNKFKQIEADWQNVAIPETADAKKLFAAHRVFMAGQAKLINVQMKQLVAVLENPKTSQGAKEAYAQEMFTKVADAEKDDLDAVQAAQIEFAEAHNIELQQ